MMIKRIAYALAVAILATMTLACGFGGNDAGDPDKPPVCAQGPDGRPRVTPCRVSTPQPIPHPKP